MLNHDWAILGHMPIIDQTVPNLDIAILGNNRLYLAILDYNYLIWQYLIYLDILDILEHAWLHFVTTGHNWSYFIIIGNTGPYLAILDHVYPHLPYLAITDNTRLYL